MKKQKDNNNLYVENPTVGYQESQEQPTYDRKVEPFDKNSEPYDKKMESYNYDDEAYNGEEPYDDDDEEEPFDEKADTRAKQIRAYGNPYIVAAFLYGFWPVGVYLMWKFRVYNKTARIILSIVMPIFSILRLTGRFSN